MRIGVDARSLTEPYPSGVSIYSYSLIAACAKLAPADQFILFTSGSSKFKSESLQTLEKFPNVEIRHLGLPNKAFHSLALARVAPKIDQIIGGCDVLLAPNLHFIPLSAGVPLVITVHDLTFELYRQFLSLRRKVWHTAVQPQRLLRRADAIIAVSDTTRNDLIDQYAIAPDKITRIYSAAPALAEPEDFPALPKRYCLALSTIEPRKNIAALVQAYEKFIERYPASQLDLVVIGSEGWKSSDIVQRMKAHSRIKFFGYVTEGQKTTAWQQATGFIYPTIYEGFGFPPLEAIQSGVPIIVSRAGALPEVLGNAAFYIDPYSIEDMILALHSLDTDDGWRTQVIEQGKLIYKYNWAETAAATLKVLQQAI